MDTLITAIQAKQNPSVVGLDPKPELIPPSILAQHIGDAQSLSAATLAQRVMDAYYEFNVAIIDAVADIVPAVKPQIAMYEAWGSAGIATYARTCIYAQQQGLYVLGDVKRGDIGSTASAYAAHLRGSMLPAMLPAIAGMQEQLTLDAWHEDAITVNPYLGSDGIQPFVDAAHEANKDVFVLVRTSNPSSSEIQELQLADSEQLYERVGDLVSAWGAQDVGKYGYSRVGAVVGATHREQGRLLRARMPHTFFLVPGYGAQGGTADDVAGMFDERGLGALVNSSRGIIGAWRLGLQSSSSDEAYADALRDPDEALHVVAQQARKAALAMREALRSVLA